MATISETLTFNLAMLRKGMSMVELAEAAGMPYRTYVSIEGGERWPRVENLEAIAKALSVPVTRLFQDPALKPTPEEALAIIGEALRESKPASGVDSRISRAMEDPNTAELIMEQVKLFEREQQRASVKSGKNKSEAG